MKNYSLSEVDNNKKWDEFILLSDEGTIFSLSNFLIDGQIKHLRKWVLKGTEIIAAIHIPLKTSNGLENLYIYTGIIHRPKRKQMNNYQFQRERFDVQVFICDYLSKTKEKFSINLNFNIKDIRPFIWKNFDDRKNTFTYDVRYTGLIKFPLNLNDLELSSFWQSKMSSSRRQEIKKSKHNDERIVLSEDTDNLLYFLEKKLTQDNVNPGSDFFKSLKTLLRKLLDSKHACLWSVIDKNNNILSNVFWVMDNKRAYYFLGSKNIDFDHKSSSAGTIVLYHSIKNLYCSKNLFEFDLEGINSPKRGWFKQSFGTNSLCYFNISN